MSAFRTSVSEVSAGSVNIRGYSQADIMENLRYAESAFLTIVGHLPTEGELRVTEVILNSLLDHGWVASTITAARYVASGNPQMIPAIAGGILTAGSNTLDPEHAFEFIRAALQRKTQNQWSVEETAAAVVADYRKQGKRIPGFGHPVHRDEDFRATIVFDTAAAHGVDGPATTMYRAVHAAFVELTGKTNVPINIDGSLACVGADLGWSANQIVAFALLAVLPGLMAHVIEEIEQAVPLRHVEDGLYEVDAIRPLPAEFNGKRSTR
jgi:citrate synthase